MAHPTGGNWKEFVSASTALKMDDRQTISKKWSNQLQLQLNGEQANNFYTSLFSQPHSYLKGSSNFKQEVNNDCSVETLSSDESDDEIQIVSNRSKQPKRKNREGEIHLLLHKKRTSVNDDVQIIDDEDCSIVSCNVTISGRTPATPADVPQTSLPSIPEYYWCIPCRQYFLEGKESHERSIVHKMTINDTTPDTRVPSFYIPPNNKGYQMLLAQGWDQRKGLGRDGSGVKFPIKTVLKLDRSGLGNSIDDPARVSHFSPGDVEAVKSCQERKKRKLGESQGQDAMMHKIVGKRKGKIFPSKEEQKEIEWRKEIYNHC